MEIYPEEYEDKGDDAEMAFCHNRSQVSEFLKDFDLQQLICFQKHVSFFIDEKDGNHLEVDGD